MKKFQSGLDMTKGGILSNLIRFSVPLMATSLLQLFYNAADVAVVGRFAGAQALAAVGSTGSLVTLMTYLFVGLSLGSNVVIAHAKGAGDEDKISRLVHTSIAMALISGVVVMGIGLFASRPMLKLMNSPEDVIDLAARYLTIYFIGMPATMIYNFGASILRAMGDTKSPLLYLSVAGIANVLLNLLTVIVFHMGVVGVALATVASQVISAAFVIVHLRNAHDCTHLEWKKIGMEMKLVREIVQVGVPSGVQSCLFSVSNVIIQSAINAQGSAVMAGNAAAGSLEGFAYVVMSAITSANLTFVSTNRGARLYGRVRRALWVSMGAILVAGFGVSMLFYALQEPLLRLYNTDAQVIYWGKFRLQYILPIYFLCGLMDVSGAHLRGIGFSFPQMLIALTGACAFRLIWIFAIYNPNPDMGILYLSYPISWSLTIAAYLVFYGLVALPRLKKEEREMMNARI
ncbi:MAG: MATE family efflux transporter [Clostridiales bacterium]|nr:MATE family efflux transporter [Clostridiales bacterium]